MSNITIYKARKIITMNRRQPVVDHVAVRDGMILGAGTLEELRGWGEFALDYRFADKVIMPGFIEGHSHSWEGAVWEDTYVGFLDRVSPTRQRHGGLKSIDAVVKRLIEVANKFDSTEKSSKNPIKGWGMDPIFLERRMVCSDLDRVAVDRPVVVVHQSGHNMNVNSYVLDKAGITKDMDIDGLGLDENGELSGELMGIPLFQVALKAVGMNPVLDMGEDIERCLWWFARSAQIAGVTTVTDLASELTAEMVTAQSQLGQNPDYPIRVVPAYLGQMTSTEAGVEKMLALKQQSSPKFRLGLIKLIVDGSIQGFTARLKQPGYFNGQPNGLWYIEPDELPKTIAAYHKAGLQVHIHTNGDEATETTIDAIEIVLKAHPDPDARITIQHCQLTHDAEYKRMKKMGVCANIFSNHLYYYGDQHYEITLGPERSERMDGAGTAQRLGINFAIHSDAPVTHLAPLFTAWCAVNRKTYSGRTLGEKEKITVDEALYAITMGAAYTLKLDNELGSIECGKRADFTVLEDDPFSVDPMSLKDIDVWGTVLDGIPFPVSEIPSE